ncbi:MAG: BACON domain-containing protein [Dysgonamonadaceae bacterium]|jgi:hypothetical protein|nr:BACON domain-containing protein [Dysgonamonadaceae bacterium]
MRKKTLRIFSLLVSCLLLLIFSGCCEKEELPYIRSDANTLSFEYEGGSQTITISSNGEWTVLFSETWCRALPRKGKGDLTVTVTVYENESPKERKALLRFVCDSKNVDIIVTQSPTPEWVSINGVKWATRNVGEPGTFVENPEDYGEYYQWNKATTDFLLIDDYYKSVYADSRSWLPANDPSPAGYRVPTWEDMIYSLLNSEYVSHDWTTRNGVKGMKFTDRATGKSIFLPATGYRYDFDGVLRQNVNYDYYWMNATIGSMVYLLFFRNGRADDTSFAMCSYGLPIRCCLIE